MAQKFNVVEVKKTTTVNVNGKLTPRSMIILQDDYGEYEVSYLGTPPAVGDVIEGKIDNVTKDGFVYHNFIKESGYNNFMKESKGYVPKTSQSQYRKRDPEEEKKITRQGFMNKMIDVFIAMKFDYEKWFKVVAELEPIYRNYVEDNTLDIDKKEEG